MRSHLAASVFATIVVAVACSDPTTADGNACPQIYEISSYGCADLHGKVLDPFDVVAANVPVIVEGLGFSALGIRTDATGRFRHRLTQFLRLPTDTVSVLLRAVSARTEPGGGSPQLLRDSVVVVVRVAPIGRVPTRTEVRMKLRVQP